MESDSKNYQWNAGEYAQHSQSQFEWASELLGRLNLLGDETLLDIGCGDGKVTAIIAESLPNGQVVGIDSSKQMIALVKDRYGSTTDSRIAFKHWDIRKLAVNDHYDVAFSNAALHWIKDHPPILRRIAKAMKKGGRLLFQMGGKGNAKQVIAVVNRLIEGRWKEYFRDFNFPYGFHGPEEYTQWLVDAGLTPHRVELIEKDMRHKGKKELAGWVKTTWLPYLERVPLDLRETFIEDIVGAYLRQYPPDSNKTAHVRMMRLEVEAFRL